MTIGISLSGGGSRGIAHVGILQALYEEGIKPTHIAGVSAGAVVGALYAQGYAPQEIMEAVKKISWKHLLRPAGWGKMGLLNLEKVGELLRQHFPHNSFEGLGLPITLSATDLLKGEEVFFTAGELIKPLLASCCVPFLFSPIALEGRLLVDGGLLNGLLYEPIAHCDITIGVHTNAFDVEATPKGMKTMLQRCFNLVLHNTSRQNLSRFDLGVEPVEVGHFSPTNFRKADALFEAGYRAMCAKMTELKQLIDKQNALPV